MTIVKDGNPVNPTYWDEELGETKVSHQQDSLELTVYMKIDQNKQQNKSL